MSGYKKYKIPRSVPQFIQTKSGYFVDCHEATVADWKTEQRMTRKEGRLQRPGVSQMVRISKVLNIPDDVKLMPRLETLLLLAGDGTAFSGDAA
jgi:hypothetical protein